MPRGIPRFLVKMFESSGLQLLTTAGLLVVCIGVAVWLILRIRARFRDNDDPTADDHQLLLRVGDLRREGDLSDEEYRSIKGRLIQRIDGSLREQADSGTVDGQNEGAT